MPRSKSNLDGGLPGGARRWARVCGVGGRYIGQASAALLGCVALSLAGTAFAADRVVLQLRFDHQFQFAGYYAAQWLGHYRDEGLDVEIRSGVRPDGSLVDVIDELAQGRADFGLAAGDALVARDKGIPLVVVASIFQQSAVEVVASAKSGIRGPADLVGLKVQAGNNPLLDVELRSMLVAEGLAPDKVSLVPTPAHFTVLQHFERLFNGEVDATLAYGLSLLWYARERGYAYIRLRPSSYGVDFYGDSLFTHRRLADDKRELVERFRRASLRGWEHALAHPEAIADRISSELPRTLPVNDLRAYNHFLAARVRELTLFPLVELGHVNPLRWQAMNTDLWRAGLVKRELDLDAFVFDADVRRRRQAERVTRLALTTAAVALAGLLLGAVYFMHRRMRERERARAELVTLNETLERRVAERTHALSEHVEALESFNRSVSHDLRGPLGGIAGLAPFAIEHVTAGRTDDAVRLLTAIGTQASHSVTLLESLLALARAESQPLAVGPVSMRALADEAVDTLRLQDGGATVPIDIDPSLPDTRGDRHLLRQVYANLIGNAVKFSARGTQPRVEVGATAPGTYFVRDNGVGFGAGDGSQIFRPFVRMHEAGYEGFGVGLSIVKRIIDRHGGAVWAESQPGQGATFYFRLPGAG